ncbi:unnamed protein product [Leptosia nina]|uniref:peptidylprolyl isomerase n=1 Tax=Leptosia nina TaxID=320188 RepID=A0AAV1J2X1_9NEOP
MTVDGEANSRDRVFMDISIGGLPSGRIVFELFNDVAPKTCENFRALCAGDKGIGEGTGKPLTYKGMVFHRVVKDFMIQGGDFSNANGTGGESIYGGTFEDETFEVKHDKPFLLSMANRGKDTNGSQFFITTQPAPHLDNVHVVFGHVVSGATLVRQLEALPVDRNARPLQDITVTNCGQLIRLKAGKKRKQDKEKTKDESDAESEKSIKKEKKKKKDKKKKRHQSDQSDGELSPEPAHPLVTTSKIDPKEIPDVPTNRFLMRATREQDKDKNDSRRDRDRPRYRDRERHSYTRSGRIVKGRGVFRYRTPSRSRSRSRSVTPPHWRQAQRRIVKLADVERIDQEREQEPPKKAPLKHAQREAATPAPQEKEEGECDTTLDQSRDEKVDYNALDFEEDVEQEEEGEIPQKRMEQKRIARPPAENRADILARALGVNPKHDQLKDGKDTRDYRRHEGISSRVVQAAPKLSSAVATVAAASGGTPEPQDKSEYDPFSLLRSTFSRNKEQDASRSTDNGENRREREKLKDHKEREKYRSERTEQKHDLRDNLRKREIKESGQEERTQRPHKNEKFDSKDKSKDRSDERRKRHDKFVKESDEKSNDRSEKFKPRPDERKSKDKSPDNSDRNKRQRSEDKSVEKEKSKDRKQKAELRDRSHDRSRLSRDRDVRDKSRERNRLGRSKDRSRETRDRRDRSRDRRDRSKDRSQRNRSKKRESKEKVPLDEFDIEGRKSKSPDRKKAVDKDKDEEQKKKEDEARKELLEIVRMIKSRQRDRENKAAEAKKKRRDSSENSSDDERSKRRRSSDRGRRRSRSRSRRSSSRRSRRRSGSGRRHRRRSSD